MRSTAATPPCAPSANTPAGIWATCWKCPARFGSPCPTAASYPPTRQPGSWGADGWNHRSAGPGSKGEPSYAWAWLATTSPRQHLLIRRSLTDPTGLAYFHTYLPPDRPVTLPTLVRVAGMRWPVEENFRTEKDHFGLDHSQVRLYTAVTRHIVLCVTALAICAVTAAAMRHTSSTLPPQPTAPDQQPPQYPGLIPLTVAETSRLYNLITRAWHTITHHLHWNHWRRRHQARARWFHQRARLRHATNDP